MSRIAVALLTIVIAASSGFGRSAYAIDPASRSADAVVIHDCLIAKGLAARDREKCIDAIAKTCMGPDAPAPQPPSNVVQCFGREQLVWESVIDDAMNDLRAGLDATQQEKLQAMHRTWKEDRDKSCAFYGDFFQGTLANPMIANCFNRETGRRAIFLKGFADEMAASPSK